MQPTVQRDCARRLLAHLEAGTTDLADEPLRLPATHFTDPDHLARERERLFRRSPTVAALSSDFGETFGRLSVLERGESARVRRVSTATQRHGGTATRRHGGTASRVHRSTAPQHRTAAPLQFTAARRNGR